MTIDQAITEAGVKTTVTKKYRIVVFEKLFAEVYCNVEEAIDVARLALSTRPNGYVEVRDRRSVVWHS